METKTAEHIFNRIYDSTVLIVLLIQLDLMSRELNYKITVIHIHMFI